MLKILILGLATIIGLSSVAIGGVISKTFEIGEGTAQPFSHKRTFEIPCNRKVEALITYSRLGRPGTVNDVPLTITLMQPAADGGEGEVVATKQVTANTSLNSTKLESSKSPLGCNKTWSVRVKANEDSSGFTVKGDIRLSFYDNLYNLNLYKGLFLENNQIEDTPINFALNSTDRSDYESSQGVIEVRGKWFHNLGIMPIKMRVEIINPRGEVVAFAVGYPQNEVNPCCSSQKLKLIYRIREYIEGTWKLRFKNLSDHDAKDIEAIATFKPSCP